MDTTARTTGQGRRSATRDDRSRRIALLVLCVGMLMIVLDAIVVNLALPAIQSDLGFSPSSPAWVVNAYLIAFGGLLLAGGVLTQGPSWHWSFVIDLPIGAAIAVLAPRLLPALVLAAIAVAVTVLRPDRRAAEEQGPEDECDCCPEAA